jgi:hypothetical protein
MPDPNPFLAPMPEPGKTVQMSVREWEFEAKDEAEVRRLLREAENFPTVRGYTLRSIEQLPDPTPAESR